MTLQFRIRPTKSLLDADPVRTETILKSIVGLKRIQVYDDRASDATFITAVVELADDQATLDSLKKGLLAMPKVTIYLVDKAGNQTVLNDTPIEEIPKFAL